MDEDDWTTIPDDDVVWSGPTRLPPPLADPALPVLNTHEMDWESFECLVLAMARSLDGGYDVRRYGRLGQAQHGLDVVAFFAERKPSVYQAKRWQAFGAGDLEEAVDRYTDGRRPFGADRIVIAVATEARDTQTIERLAELREKHKGMEIELWDRRAISDSLRNQANIVSTFFGPATAAAFCTTTPEDVELALDAAHAAKDAWGETSATERADVLNGIADVIEKNAEMLAVAESWENGKPVRETLNADILLVVDHFRYFPARRKAAPPRSRRTWSRQTQEMPQYHC